MKFCLPVILLFALFAQPLKLLAQDDDDGNEIKMTQAEWHLKRDQYAVSAITLLSRIETLSAQIDSLKILNHQSDSIVANSEDNLYALVGASREQVADFRNRFGSFESKLKNNNSAPDELRNELTDFAESKIRCLPEFADRFEQMRKKISMLDVYKKDTEHFSNDQSYEVVSGDCLWNIATIKYGNPLLWPAIWDANRSGVVNKENVDFNFEKRISNPNLIYPGQVLKLPSVTLKDKDKD